MLISEEKNIINLEYNGDLSTINWERVCELFYNVNWNKRYPNEIKEAFEKSSHTIFAYDNDLIIGFGRTVDDGKYYAMLADIVIDPGYQKKGLGKRIVNKLKEAVLGYHFITLTAAPGKSDFYKNIGWKKQSTSYIWPQTPKQVRQHCEKEKHIEGHELGNFLTKKCVSREVENKT
ncbi:MAG: family N-acetyltransferase [Sphingobacteriales bacterium]|nr:family N-acetyltransferase [Sphingobacteriales bacterium]